MTKQKKFRDITLALAGVLQAARCVNDLAQRGVTEEPAYNALMYSLCQIDAPDIESIFSNSKNLNYGLKGLIYFLQKHENIDRNILRYFFTLFALERKLAKNNKLMSLLAKRVQQASQQANFFTPTHPNVVKNFASIYLDTLSTFRYRLQVVGQPQFLHSENILERIRALLLAGIRCVILWRQVGGSRWQFLFSQKKILYTAKALLQGMD